MSPKGCGKIYNTIIRSQRQNKRFRTLNPAEDLGFKLYCYCKKGSIINATQHKALATLVGGWNLMMNGREIGALGPGKTGRISGGGLEQGQGVGQLILILFYLTQEGCKKQREKNQAASDVKWNSQPGDANFDFQAQQWTQVSQWLQNGPSLESYQNKLLPITFIGSFYLSDPAQRQLRGTNSCSSLVQILDAGFLALTPSADSPRLNQLPLARERLTF